MDRMPEQSLRSWALPLPTETGCPFFTAIAMCCFAFSTILGWGLYGARCVEFLLSATFIKPFMVIYALVSIPGATMDLGLLWSIADTFNGLMSIPNLIAVFLLSGTVIRLTREYFSKNA